MSLWGRKAALRGGVALIGLIAGTSAWAQTRSFDVPSENAVDSIPEFARQAGIQIVAPADQLEGVRTPAVKGSLELHAALADLLKGTNFEIASDDGQTITLKAKPKNAAQNGSTGAIETVVVTGTNIRGVDNPISP